MALLHEDRLFPAEEGTRAIARRLYEGDTSAADCEPARAHAGRLVREDEAFPDPVALFVQPDHYIFRMLYSQGISLEELEIGKTPIHEPRKVWRLFASNYHLFRGTPSRLWLDFAFQNTVRDDGATFCGDREPYYDAIEANCARRSFGRGHCMSDSGSRCWRRQILRWTRSSDHAAIRASGWKGRILPTFRPDAVVDPAFAGFGDGIARLGALTGEDTATWRGYLRALAARRAFFKIARCDGNGPRTRYGADRRPEHG